MPYRATSRTTEAESYIMIATLLITSRRMDERRPNARQSWLRVGYQVNSYTAELKNDLDIFLNKFYSLFHWNSLYSSQAIRDTDPRAFCALCGPKITLRFSRLYIYMCICTYHMLNYNVT